MASEAFADDWFNKTHELSCNVFFLKYGLKALDSWVAINYVVELKEEHEAWT